MPAKKQIPRDKILAAAFELLREGGIEAVNVKALARRLNCSTQPIYLSFSRMEELRSALVSEAVTYISARPTPLPCQSRWTMMPNPAEWRIRPG